MLVLSVDLSDLPRVADFRGLFDLLEIRLQEQLSSDQEQMLQRLNVPVLLSPAHEGLLASLGIQPHIIDLPFDVSPSAMTTARALFPKALLQGSYHSSEKAAPDFACVMQRIFDKGFDAAKIAWTTSTTHDVVALLAFLKKNSSTAPLTCVPMGPAGQFGRVLAATMGSYLCYCCLPGRPTAPGQIDIATMHAVYAASSLSSKTQRFALVGEQVEGSPSHRTHTKLLRSFGVDGLYVKIPVQKEEAKEILPLIAELGFSGLSVTTPLKEMIGNFAFPINTLKCTASDIKTTNTDAPALIDAVETHLQISGARVLLLGAGAVSKASAQALAEKGADIFVYNRTYTKSCQLASSVGGTPVTEESLLLDAHYDLVVNTTSAHCFPPFPKQLSMIPFSSWGVQLAAEFAFPSKTPFLSAAEAQGVRIISGKELWARQAAKQFQWWCDIDEGKAFAFLKEELSCRSPW